MRTADPVLRAAFFLHSHRGWSPADLETADPELVEAMHTIDSRIAAAARRA